MVTVLKGVFSDNKLYQMWVEPPTPVLPEYIRNDYNSSINTEPIRTLAAGSVSSLVKQYDAHVELMRIQCIADGCTATQVPTSPFDI